MKVLLLNQISTANEIRKKVVPSTLVGLGSMLLDQPKLGLSRLPGVEVAIDACDMRDDALPRYKLEELLKKHSPNVVGLGVYEIEFNETIAIINRIAELDPNILIAVGGPMATALPFTTFFQTGAHAIFRGEADFTFREFIKMYSAGQVRPLPGVIMRDFKTGLLGPVNLANDIPVMSAKDFRNMRFDPELLAKTIETGEYTKLDFSTARGCFFGSCPFCSVSDNWRRLSDNETVEEFERLSKFGLQLRPNDSSFGGPGKSLPNLLDKMAGRFQNLSIFLSVDQLLPDGKVGNRPVDLLLIEKLKLAGVKEIFLGVESFSDSMLQRIKSGRYSGLEAKEVILHLSRGGFELVASFILADCMSFAREMMDTIEGMHQVAKRFIIEKLPLPNFSLNPVVIPSVGSKYYTEVCELAAKGELEIVGERSMDTGIPYYNLFPVLPLHRECDMGDWFDITEKIAKQHNLTSGYPHEKLRTYEYLTRIILSHLEFTYNEGMKARAESNV